MLSTSNDNANARLRRAKSTSSVPRKPVLRSTVSQDRVDAHQHAITAASVAFERARVSHNLDGRRPQLSRTTSRRLMAQPRTSGEGSHLRRRNSQYDPGGWDRSRAPSTGRYEASFHSSKQPQSTMTHTPSINDDVFSITSPDQRLADRFDGYGIPFTSRLRRARSTQGHPPAHPISLTPPAVLTRRLTVAAPATREDQTDDSIIALARDKYLSDHQMKPLRKRSSFFAPLLGKTRKVKLDSIDTDEKIDLGKHSFETDLPIVPESNQSSNPPVHSFEPAPVINHTKTEIRRKASLSMSSLKRGFNRTFGRSTRSSSGTIELPPQHVISTRTHGIDMTTRTSIDSLPPVPAMWQHQHQQSISPSPPTPPPHRYGFNHSPPRPTVKYNFANNENEVQRRSRVTSWNDSTRRNTIMTLDAAQLPSIQESPETRKQSFMSSGQDDLATTGRPEVPIRRSSSRFTLRGAVDSKRLVSALIKHKKSMSGATESDQKPSLMGLSRRPSETTRREEIVSTPPVAYEAALPVPSTGQDANDLFAGSCQHEYPDQSFDNRRDQYVSVVSPSLYSDRGDDIKPVGRARTSFETSHAPGMATVLDQEAVTSYALGHRRLPSHKHTTSNEWRSWVAGEASGLEGRVSFTIPAFSGPTAIAWSDAEAHDRNAQPNVAGSSDDLDSSPQPDTPDWIEVTPTRTSKEIMTRRPSLRSRQPSNNSTSRRSSKLEPFPELSLSSAEDEASIPDDRSYHSEQAIDHEPSNVDLLAKPGRKLSMPKFMSFRKSSGKQSRLPRPSELASQSSSSKKPIAKRASPALEENFLLRIRKGPYNASGNTLARLPTSSNSISLPKRSSPAVGDENTPPSRGQRMADEFLSSRSKNGHSSPAFM